MTSNNNDNGNCIIQVRACPITRALVNNNGVIACSPRHKDVIFIEPKIKLKLHLRLAATGNITSSPVIDKYKPYKDDGGTYKLSRNLLKSEDINDPTSQSWRSVSKTVSDITTYLPFPLLKLWRDHWGNDGNQEMIGMVLKEAQQSAAANNKSSMCSSGSVDALCVSVKMVVVLDHDGFVSCVHQIEKRGRVREVLEECVAMARLRHHPVDLDAQTMKRELVASFGEHGLLNRLTELELKSLADRAMATLALV